MGYMFLIIRIHFIEKDMGRGEQIEKVHKKQKWKGTLDAVESL